MALRFLDVTAVCTLVTPPYLSHGLGHSTQWEDAPHILRLKSTVHSSVFLVGGVLVDKGRG